MLFGIWQLKITVYVLLLASSLGEEHIRTCNREYCYEASTEGRYGTNHQIDWQRFSSGNRGDSRELIKHIRDDNPSEDRIERIIDNEDQRVDRDSRRDSELGEEVLCKGSRRIENVPDKRQQRNEYSRRVDEKNIRQEERESRHYISHQENQNSRYEDKNLNRNRYDNGREARSVRREERPDLRTLERNEFKKPKSISENGERQKEQREIIRLFDNARFQLNIESIRENYERVDRPERANSRRYDSNQSRRENDERQEERREINRQLDNAQFYRKASTRENSEQIEQREISRRIDNDARIEQTDSRLSYNSEERRDESERDSAIICENSRERNRRVGEQTDARQIINRIDAREESLRIGESNERQRNERQEKSSEVSRRFDDLRILRSKSRTYRVERLTDNRQTDRDITRRDSIEKTERREINRRPEGRVRSADTIRDDHQLKVRQAQRQEFKQDNNEQVKRRLIDERLGSQEIIRVEMREASRFVGREVNEHSYERETRENAHRLDDREFHRNLIEVHIENARRNDVRRIEQRSKAFERSQERNNPQTVSQIEERESRRVLDTFENRDLNRRSDKLNARQIADPRNINLFSENAEDRADFLRRIDEHRYQQENVKSKEDILSRNENGHRFNNEHENNLRSPQTYIQRERKTRQRRDENKREHGETTRRFDERELQREINRRLEQERESGQVDLLQSDEHYIFRERESRQRRDEDRSEATMRLNQQDPAQNTERRSERDTRDYQRGRVENNRDREEGSESTRRFEDREPQREITRHVEEEHGSRRIGLLRSDERDLQRISKSIQRRDVNKLNHEEGPENTFLLNKRESQRNTEPRSKDERGLRRVDLLQESQTNSELRQRRGQNKREHDKTSTHFNVRENLQRNIKRHSEDGYDYRVREEVTRRLDERGSLRDISRRIENARADNGRDIKNRFGRESLNENKRQSMEHREELRRLDESEYRISNEEKSQQNRNERSEINEREARKDESETRVEDTRRSESFTAQRENPSHIIEYRYVEDDKAEKPYILLKNGYFAVGQGVLLAFVIMQTLNDKDELKHKIPQKLREVFSIIGI